LVEISIGTVSSRGQVAIPLEMRNKLHFDEGKKIIFLLEGDALVIKRADSLSWESLTKPLREAKKKLNEDGVDRLVHGLRKAGA